MEDYDWIQIAYIFESEPSIESYESLFGKVLTYLNKSPRTGKVEAVYWNEDDERNEGAVRPNDAAQIASEYPTMKVNLETVWDDISIGFEKQGKGFPSYDQTPYLRFTTWIYALKDTDDEQYLETIKQYRRNFAEIHAQAANILEPTWGFGRRGGLAIGEDETIEDLATRTKPPLYEYNVFRPETVKAIGREKVLSAPAYYVEELDSGGVFMAVTEPPKQCGHEGQQCEEVADQLGLDLSTPERYH